MHVPGGMKSLVMGAEIVAGAALGAIVDANIPASDDGTRDAGTLFGQQASLVVGAGLVLGSLFAGADLGKHLLAVGVGMATPPAAKALVAKVAPDASVQGMPLYAIGQLPGGANILAIPPGQPVYANPAAVAGLI